MRIELFDRVQQPEAIPDAKLCGRFFSETVRLVPGSYAVRVQIIFSKHAAGELIRIHARQGAPPIIALTCLSFQQQRGTAFCRTISI